MTPAQAFLRSLLIPGWGHASIGEHTRGGFYFLAESASAWMLVRTLSRRGAANAVQELRMAEVAARQAALGVTDPRAIAAAQDSDTAVREARALTEARRQHVQDWLALGIFLVFLSGADAFVSAHLKDFPSPVRPALGSSGPALDLGVSLPAGGSFLRR